MERKLERLMQELAELKESMKSQREKEDMPSKFEQYEMTLSQKKARKPEPVRDPTKFKNITIRTPIDIYQKIMDLNTQKYPYTTRHTFMLEMIAKEVNRQWDELEEETDK